MKPDIAELTAAAFGCDFGQKQAPTEADKRADSIVEIAARAILDERTAGHIRWDDLMEFFRDEYRDQARAALRAADDHGAMIVDAATKALHAIDTVLSSHEGQHEHAELKAAFDALEKALNTLEPQS